MINTSPLPLLLLLLELLVPLEKVLVRDVLRRAAGVLGVERVGAFHSPGGRLNITIVTTEQSRYITYLFLFLKIHFYFVGDDVIIVVFVLPEAGHLHPPLEDPPVVQLVLGVGEAADVVELRKTGSNNSNRPTSAIYHKYHCLISDTKSIILKSNWIR